MNLSRFIALRIYRNSEPGKQVSRPAVLIAMVGIALGLAVMIIAVSVIVGFKSEVRNKIVGFGAHIQIGNLDAARSYETRPVVVGDSMMAGRNSALVANLALLTICSASPFTFANVLKPLVSAPYAPRRPKYRAPLAWLRSTNSRW